MFIVVALLMIPFIEISLAIAIVKRFGFGNAFFVWLVSLILGFGLFRSSTLRLTVGVAQAIREGKPPGLAAVDGAMIGLAGVLFLLPGYFSDVCALILLLPFVRSYAARRLHGAFSSGTVFTAGAARGTGPSASRFDPDDAAHAVLDVDAVVINDESAVIDDEPTNKGSESSPEERPPRQTIENGHQGRFPRQTRD